MTVVIRAELTEERLYALVYADDGQIILIGAVLSVDCDRRVTSPVMYHLIHTGDTPMYHLIHTGDLSVNPTGTVMILYT